MKANVSFADRAGIVAVRFADGAMLEMVVVFVVPRII